MRNGYYLNEILVKQCFNMMPITSMAHYGSIKTSCVVDSKMSLRKEGK